MHREEPLAPESRARYREWVLRRAAREPLQHVVHEAEFCGLKLRSDGRALVPRPETEGLVEAALALDLPPGSRVADLGTGSGAIAIALAVARPDLELWALDLSPQALALAQENAELHGVASRIRFELGDMAAPPAAWRGQMRLVLSNPPYVAAAEWEALEPEVRRDPRAALVAGPSGLEAYEALAGPARELLAPGGHLVLELGAGQAREVERIVAAAGLTVREVRRDFRGIERVLVAAS